MSIFDDFLGFWRVLEAALKRYYGALLLLSRLLLASQDPKRRPENRGFQPQMRVLEVALKRYYGALLLLSRLLLASQDPKRRPENRSFQPQMRVLRARPGVV